MFYSEECIKKLTDLIRGNDKARVWLQQNKHPELILLHYAIDQDMPSESLQHRKEQALEELTRMKNHIVLIAFVHAINGDNRAANWLSQNKKYEWAAIVSMVNKKDKNAEAWLIRNKLSHYASLGKAILEKEDEFQEDDVVGLFKRLIKALRKKR